MQVIIKLSLIYALHFSLQLKLGPEFLHWPILGNGSKLISSSLLTSLPAVYHFATNLWWRLIFNSSQTVDSGGVLVFNIGMSLIENSSRKISSIVACWCMSSCQSKSWSSSVVICNILLISERPAQRPSTHLSICPQRSQFSHKLLICNL
jgi:hypothetical protein